MTKMYDLNILFVFIKRKLCKKTNKTNMIFFISTITTVNEHGGTIPFQHEVSLVVCLIAISRSVDVVVFPFPVQLLSSTPPPHRHSWTRFLSVKHEMCWRNISGSPFFPPRSSQSLTIKHDGLDRRASHSYNMYIYSTCIEK